MHDTYIALISPAEDTQTSHVDQGKNYALKSHLS